MTEDKWASLRITNPGLWERRERAKEHFKKAREELRLGRGADGEIPEDERVGMAREFVGELAQDIEIGEDGSVTVHLPNFH